MLGAIAGDVIGSVFEWDNCKSTRFPLLSPDSSYTDDTVLTVATAQVLLDGGTYAAAYRSYYQRFPDAGYGGRFRAWASGPPALPYHSFGNGSAMRVAPVGHAFANRDRVLAEATRSAAVTHDHPEGIKGAQAVALAVALARGGASKDAIRGQIEAGFGYDLGTPLDHIRPDYAFDVSCQGSVPPALRAFLEADGFEHAVRLAVSIGGDSDTIACITGAVAEPFFGGVPRSIATAVLERLPQDLVRVVERFCRQHPLPTS